MKEIDFFDLASSIKTKLQQRLTSEQLENDYIYNAINRLVIEVRKGSFSSETTDIGIAAVKLFDSNNDEDNSLVRDISNLGQMYKKIQKQNGG